MTTLRPESADRDRTGPSRVVSGASRRGRPFVPIALVSLAFLVPAALGAQVRFTPQVGLYAPASDLGEVDAAGGAVEFGDQESTLAFGLNLDFGRADTGTGFRASLLYGTESDVPVEGVGCPDCSARAQVVALTGALVLRPIPRLAIVQPYGIAGAGAKWYSFDAEDVEDLVDDQARLMGQLGLGLEVGTGQGLRIVGELTDNISGFEFEDGEDGDLQHDFFLMLGVVLGG